MIAIVKRILKISGKYRKNVILGRIFSGLKSFFVSLMLLAILLIMINLEQLNMTIITVSYTHLDVYKRQKAA